MQAFMYKNGGGGFLKTVKKETQKYLHFGRKLTALFGQFRHFIQYVLVLRQFFCGFWPLLRGWLQNLSYNTI